VRVAVASVFLGIDELRTAASATERAGRNRTPEWRMLADRSASKLTAFGDPASALGAMRLRSSSILGTPMRRHAHAASDRGTKSYRLSLRTFRWSRHPAVGPADMNGRKTSRRSGISARSGPDRLTVGVVLGLVNGSTPVGHRPRVPAHPPGSQLALDQWPTVPVAGGSRTAEEVDRRINERGTTQAGRRSATRIAKCKPVRRDHLPDGSPRFAIGVALE